MDDSNHAPGEGRTCEGCLGATRRILLGPVGVMFGAFLCYVVVVWATH